VEKEAEKKLRLFVAIHLRPEVKESLATVQRQLAPIAKDLVRWTPQNQLHLTLLFLGSVSPSQLSELQISFKAACATRGSMLLRAEGLGCFPNLRRPNVIWCGVGGQIEPLLELQKNFSESLRPWRQKIETRAFHPHLTIGRVREGARTKKLTDALGAKETEFFGEWQARSCSLMQSQLSPRGALHSEVLQCTFG
jgi:2'-5' RNA ligase